MRITVDGPFLRTYTSVPDVLMAASDEHQRVLSTWMLFCDRYNISHASLKLGRDNYIWNLDD